VARAGKAVLARAAMSAAEPLVELFLELGVTSPEAESLLRSLFVHTARAWLARSRPAAGVPSDVRVSLVTGVHRNFVRRILAEPPRIAAEREEKGHPAERVLEAWHSVAKYLDSSGKPRDLSEKDQEPSFQTLVMEELPGASPGMVLAELRRAGAVQILAEHRVRVRSRRFRWHGINAGNIGEFGSRGRELLDTLTHNLREPASRRFCESMPAIEIDATRAPFVRDLIARRASTFLTAMEQELTAAVSGTRAPGNTRRVRIGLTAVETLR
jgi:hypothetical protein